MSCARQKRGTRASKRCDAGRRCVVQVGRHAKGMCAATAKTNRRRTATPTATAGSCGRMGSGTRGRGSAHWHPKQHGGSPKQHGIQHPARYITATYLPAQPLEGVRVQGIDNPWCLVRVLPTDWVLFRCRVELAWFSSQRALRICGPPDCHCACGSLCSVYTPGTSKPNKSK